MSLAKLIWSSVGAVGGTGLIIMAGYYFAYTKSITSTTAKELSKLTLFFFSGCLMFINLAESVNLQNIQEMWGVPVFVFLFYAINWLAAQIFSRLLGVKHLWRFITASVMFGNNNNWPVALVQALADNHQKDLDFRKKPMILDDSYDIFASPKNTLASRGLAYVFLYAMFSNLVRWSYGYTLLATNDEPLASPQLTTSPIAETPTDDPDVITPQPDVTTPLLKSSIKSPTTSSRKSVTFQGRQRGNLKRRQSLSSGTDEALTSYDSDDDSDLSLDPTPMETIKNTWETIKTSKFGKTIKLLTGPFDNPPMKASLFGLLFAFVDPLKHLLFGPGAPLKMLIAVPLKHCGDASVPLTLVGLGVSLHKVMQDRARRDVRTEEEKKKSGQVNRSIVFICLWRLIINPIMSVGIVMLLRPYMELLRIDPMFVMVLLILSSSPTAINLQQIAAVHGHFEAELSWCLLWQYGLVVPIMSACVAGWLWWIKQLEWEPVKSTLLV